MKSQTALPTWSEAPDSWWVGLTPDEFYRQVQEQLPRMRSSKIGHSLRKGYYDSPEDAKVNC